MLFEEEEEKNEKFVIDLRIEFAFLFCLNIVFFIITISNAVKQNNAM